MQPVSALLKNGVQVVEAFGARFTENLIPGDRIDLKDEVVFDRDSPGVYELIIGGTRFLKFSSKSWSHIRHTVFCKLLGFPDEESEIPLSKMQALGDYSDELTPDFTFMIDDTLHFLEVTFSDDVSALNRKEAKYISAIQKREDISGQKMVLLVIQITQHFVRTNFPLTKELVEKISKADLIAKHCSQDASNKGWVEARTEHDTHNSIKQIFNDIDLNHMTAPMNKSLIPDRENEDEEKRESRTRLAKDKIARCFEEAKEEVKSDSDPGFSCIASGEGIRFTGEILNESLKKQMAEIDAYVAKVSGDKDARNFNKSVFHIPFMTPVGVHKITTDLSEFPDIPEDFKEDETSCYSRLFSAVSAEIKGGRVARAADEEDDTLDEKGRPDKRAYHRAFVKIDDEDKEIFAKTGPFGKSYLDKQSVSDYRKDSKRGLSFNCDTSDVDCFLNDLGLLEPMDKAMSRDEIEIIEASLLTHDLKYDDFGIDFVKGVLGSKLGQYSTLVSDISQELCSSLQQHCKSKSNKDEVIVKKIRNYDLWMVVRPTSSLKHIFFTLLWKTESFTDPIHTSVFKKPLTRGEWSYLPWRSFNKSKLSTALLTESDLIAYYATWLDIFQVGIYREMDQGNRKTMAIKYTLLSILVHMNDKTRVEEMMTLVRYTCMESFVQLPIIPKVVKMLPKFPKIFRSRLEIWVVKKQLNLMRRFCSGHLYQARLGDWCNLVDPYFQLPLTSPYQLVNSFYVGYAKNKSELGQANQEAQLVEKIIEYEQDFDPEFPYGLVEPEDEEGHKESIHDYSPAVLMYILEHVEEMLSSANSGWREDLEYSILKAIDDLDFVTLATTKASTGFTKSSSEMKYTTMKGNKVKLKEKFSRPRVMEALQDFMKKYTFVWESLKEISEMMKGPQKLDIFKKLQRGGLREIYVLAGHIRSAQAVVETIARCICDMFTSEMMSHPNKKMPTINEHAVACKKKIKELKRTDEDSHLITVGTSDDASKWSQGHLVTKFVTSMCFMLPSYFHNFIANFFNTWMHRKILIPRGLMESVLNNHHKEFHPESFMSTMTKAYKGEIDPVWWPGPARSKEAFIEISSGMMQGIPHFVSSFFHTIIQEFWKSIVEELPEQIMCSVMQSSDDSGALLTLPYNLKNGAAHQIMTAQILFRAKHKIARLLGITNSKKSTTGTIDMIEFNSEFVFLNNQFRPVFRWAAVANIMSDEETIVSWQNEMSNLLTQVLEGGATISCCHVVQISQALIFYRILGSRTMKAFSRFQELILRIMDPGKGFFLMDNVKLCGMMGTKNNIYINCLKNPLFQSLMRGILENPEALEKNPITPGFATTAATIKFGNVKKAESLMERLGVPSDLDEQLNEHPEAIFLQIHNVSMARLKFLAKISSVSMYKSFSKSNSAARLATISPYVLTSKCFLSKGEKKSLLTLLEEDLLIPKSRLLTDEQLNLIFPYKRDYDRAASKARMIYIEGGHPIDPLLERKDHQKMSVSIWMTQKRADLIAPALSLARFKWFEVGYLDFSFDALEHAWSCLKDRVPWLKDSIKDTLDLEYIRNVAQLKDLLAKLDEDHRKINLSGFVAAKSDYSQNIEMIISRNFSPLYWIQTQKMISSQVLEDREKNLRNSLLRVLTSPCMNLIKADLIQNVARHKECDVSEYLTPKAGDSIRPIAVLQLILKKSRTEFNRIKCDLTDDIMNCLAQSKGVIIGKWTVMQYKEDGKWLGEGEWAGRVLGTGVIATVKDDVCVSIQVGDRRNIQEVIRTTLRSLELRVSNVVVDNKDPRSVFCGKPWNGYIHSCGVGTPVIVSMSPIPFPEFKGIEIELTEDCIYVRVMEEKGFKDKKFRPLKNCTWMKMSFNRWDFQPHRKTKLDYSRYEQTVDGRVEYPVPLSTGEVRGYLRIWLESGSMTLPELDDIYQAWKDPKLEGCFEKIYWATKTKIESFIKELCSGKFYYDEEPVVQYAAEITPRRFELITDVARTFDDMQDWMLKLDFGPSDLEDLAAEFKAMDVLIDQPDSRRSIASSSIMLTVLLAKLDDLRPAIAKGYLPPEYSQFREAIEWATGKALPRAVMTPHMRASLMAKDYSTEIEEEKAESSVTFPDLPAKVMFPKEDDMKQDLKQINDLIKKKHHVHDALEMTLEKDLQLMTGTENGSLFKAVSIATLGIISPEALRRETCNKLEEKVLLFSAFFIPSEGEGRTEYMDYISAIRKGCYEGSTLILKALSHNLDKKINVFIDKGEKETDRIGLESVSFCKSKKKPIILMKEGRMFHPILYRQDDEEYEYEEED